MLADQTATTVVTPPIVTENQLIRATTKLVLAVAITVNVRMESVLTCHAPAVNILTVALLLELARVVSVMQHGVLPLPI